MKESKMSEPEPSQNGTVQQHCWQTMCSIFEVPVILSTVASSAVDPNFFTKHRKKLIFNTCTFLDPDC
jgi:hypothetical protein